MLVAFWIELLLILECLLSFFFTGSKFRPSQIPPPSLAPLHYTELGTLTSYPLDFQSLQWFACVNYPIVPISLVELSLQPKGRKNFILHWLLGRTAVCGRMQFTGLYLWVTFLKLVHSHVHQAPSLCLLGCVISQGTFGWHCWVGWKSILHYRGQTSGYNLIFSHSDTLEWVWVQHSMQF